MTFILTGMHRSGTSMFARFMHESGISMGKDFYVDKTSNKYGHYEDLDFLNLQRNELARQFSGEDYLIFSHFSPSETFVEQSKKLYAERQNSNTGQDWGWKDPRTTVFLKHWHTVDPEIKYVFMVRRPEAVVRSLTGLLKTRWSVKEIRKYLQTNAFYNRCILSFIRSQYTKNFVVISLEKLVEYPDIVLDKVSEKLNFAFDHQLYLSLFDRSQMSGTGAGLWLYLAGYLKDARDTYYELKPYFV